MRLFGYYAWHTFKNQVRKMCKTWVVVFLLICIVIGCIIGFGAAKVSDLAQSDDVESVVPEEFLPEEELLPGETIPEESDEEDEEFSLPVDIVELAVGGLLLLFFTFEAVSADKNGSKIFLPADVNLLFASPMQPQSVLLFRLMTQIGAALLGSAYLLFQLPNLMNMGLSLWGGAALIATWALALIVGKLLQMLLYTICSTRPGWKSRLRPGIYAVLTAAALGYVVYWQVGGGTYYEALVGYFNHPATRYIPLWGWLKGFTLFAVEENWMAMLAELAAVVLGSGVLAYVIWHLKADFYEDAMAKSQETAELLEQVQSQRSTVLVRRKKERSDKIRRDGLTHGWGANVFFHKSLYNRFRFAHWKIFTKTSETYLLAAVGVAALCRFVMDVEGVLPVMLTLGVFTFFRSLGNPLAEDTEMDFFILIPEPAWKKLLWSLLGGSVNCVLDLLPATVVALALLGGNPLPGLLWLPVIVSVDFFATTVSTFIHLSTPTSAGKIVKQMVQVLFIYFGLLPDIGIVAAFLAMGQPVMAALGAAICNVLLGLLFFALASRFLEPKGGKMRNMENENVDIKAARRSFSRVGLSTVVLLVVGSLVQLAMVRLLPQWVDHPWGRWVCMFAPIYLVAFPLALLLLRTVPAKKPEAKTMRLRDWLVAIPMCVCLMYVGSIVGNALMTLLQNFFGTAVDNPVESLLANQPLLPQILIVVILGPLVEEFVFRKQILDRLRVYGEKTALLVSAALFGLFHGNLSQLFYAFLLGLLFGYIYLRTGKLRYSAALHMLINLVNGVLGSFILEHMGAEAFGLLDNLGEVDFGALERVLPWVIAFGIYTLVMLALGGTGLVLLCTKASSATFAPSELELPRKGRWRTVWCNVGMLLALAVCMALIVMSLL